MATKTDVLDLTLYTDRDAVDVLGLSENYRRIDEEAGRLRAEKANRPAKATDGHLAALDSSGNLMDAGKSVGELSLAGHIHDDRYYTQTEVNSRLDGKAPMAHTHDDRYYTKAQADDLFAMLDAHAPSEMHRIMFRGKNLGGAVTAEQKANIQNGSFKGLFLGDYWEIGGVHWRIADFNYWMNCGDNAVPSTHLVIMPDAVLYTAQMNETDTTNGGYVGSKMYTANLNQAKNMASSAFPGMVLSHREYLVNAFTNGKPSAGAWYDSTVELPNEIMMYGSYVFTPANDGQPVPVRHTISSSQLALMSVCPKLIKIRQGYWLRDAIATGAFAYMGSWGDVCYSGASSSLFGVRPVFAIG